MHINPMRIVWPLPIWRLVSQLSQTLQLRRRNRGLAGHPRRGDG